MLALVCTENWLESVSPLECRITTMSLAPLMKSKDCRNPSQMLPICAQTGREGRPTPAREGAREKCTPPSGWSRGSRSARQESADSWLILEFSVIVHRTRTAPAASSLEPGFRARAPDACDGLHGTCLRVSSCMPLPPFPLPCIPPLCITTTTTIRDALFLQ